MKLFGKNIDYSSHPAYAQYQQINIHQNELLDDMTFTVLDTETTGFDLKEDQIISIGAIKVSQGAVDIQQSAEWNFTYQADENGNHEHISIHQLTPKNAQSSTSEYEQYEQFLNFIQNSVLVGHNVSFDINMLNQKIKKLFSFTLFNTTLDTAQLAIRLHQGSSTEHIKHQEFGLDALCEKYHITPFDRHNAAGDTLLTAILLLKLLSACKDKGITKRKHLMKKNWWF